MATIDYTIPGQLKGIQIEPPMNAMARAMELRGLQEASNLNAMKMQEYARARQEENALRQLFASGLKPDSDEFRNRLYAEAPGLAPNIEKGLLERGKVSAEVEFKKAQKKKEDAEALSKKLTFHREVFNPFAVTTPEEAGAHAAAFYDDPDFSPYATKMMPREMAVQKSKDLFKTDRRAWLMSQIQLSGDKILEATDRKDSADYSAYVNAELAAGRYPASKNEFLQLNTQQAAPVVDATGEVAPVSDAAVEQPQPAAAAESRVLPKIAVTGRDDGMPGLHPYAEALYSTGSAADKAKADKIQANYVEEQKSKRLSGDFLNVLNAQKQIIELEKNPTPENKRLIKVLEGQIAASEKGKGTTLTIGGQEKEFEKELGKGQAKELLESRTRAEDAREILSTVKIGRDILKSGVITGAGADFFVGLNQALKTAGVDMGYADAAANSQAYAANMANNVGKLIKQFGAGTGLSDSDRKYAEQMAGGRISLDKKALEKILGIQDRAARNVISYHNQKVKGVKTNIPLAVELDETAAPPAAPKPKSAIRSQADAILGK